MTFEELVERDAAIDRTAFECKTLAEAMKNINGIVFIYARWSGAAIHSWRTLSRVLSGVDRRPRILVVDADEFSADLASELIGELPQGRGETYWILEGQIVANLDECREGDSAVILEHSKRVMS